MRAYAGLEVHSRAFLRIYDKLQYHRIPVLLVDSHVPELDDLR
jgi:hypothetical protein